ncbi:MAG: hypothetical protein IPO30_05800 [Hyphomonadaceae bacterium]|nr:hypothetical protein [Hyphomonadaceae bacterium]MBP9235754.1 hypothetical protein [Hyphomonadaceae bacterium]
MAPGFLGAAVLKGRSTEIMDIGDYLGQADPAWAVAATPLVTRRTRKRVLLVDAHPFFRNMLAAMVTAAATMSPSPPIFRKRAGLWRRTSPSMSFLLTRMQSRRTCWPKSAPPASSRSQAAATPRPSPDPIAISCWMQSNAPSASEKPHDRTGIRHLSHL